MVLCDTKLFSFFIQTCGKYYDLTTFLCTCACVHFCVLIHACVKCCTQMLFIWGGVYVQLQLWRCDACSSFLISNLSPPFSSLHFAASPVFHIPLFISFLSYAPYPFLFLCHHLGSKGVCWILVMNYVEDSLGYCLFYVDRENLFRNIF